MYSNLARAAAIAAALLAAVPAIAGGEKSISVSYADLNLANATDRNMLDRRVQTAARRVCEAGQRDLARQLAANRCVAAALASTRPAIDLAFRNAGNRQFAARDMSVTVAP